MPCSWGWILTSSAAPEHSLALGVQLQSDNLPHTKAVLAAWKHDYNHHRPHSAHGGATPVEFAEKADIGHALYRLEQTARNGQCFETGLTPYEWREPGSHVIRL